MRKINIVLFSSGISENNGILFAVKNELEKRGYNCCYWRDLFSNAHDASNIALLPMLLKKIPTFDFAVLICEGHDKVVIKRGDTQEEAFVMRDNVLFEIGLCSMALGLPKTILLTDDVVRLPDDLIGTNNQLALKRITYKKLNDFSYQNAANETGNYIDDIQFSINNIDDFIKENSTKFSPVSIGAAATIACGYVSNFIFRTLENIHKGVVLDGKKMFFEPEKVFFHIVLPISYSEQIPKKVAVISNQYKSGIAPYSKYRSAEFLYEKKGDELHIYDYPTTIVTSYYTAMMILELEADDYADPGAKDRFNAKELDLFENTLHSLLKPQFVEQTVSNSYDDAEKDEVISRINKAIKNIVISRIDY